MSFGEKIRNAREDLDMSQSEIARLIPMNQSNYSKIERDIQEPSLEQLKRICEILNLDPRFLLGLGDLQQFSKEDISILNDVKNLINKHTLKN